MPRRLTCLFLWIAFVGIFAASLPDRRAHLDDAWLGEQAFHLAREGVVRSDLFHGFLGYEDRIWVFHKLFIPQGALAIDLFGWSRTTLKAVSLPWFVLGLSLLAFAVRRDRHIDDRLAVWAPLFLLAHPLMVDYAYTFRPEVCLTALGLGSYLALRRHLEEQSRGALVLSAVLAGLGVLVHLNGLMFIAAGLGVLGVERRWRASLAFVAIAGSLSALYIVDALAAGELPALAGQFSRDPSLESRDFQVLGLLGKLLEEPRRWIEHGEDLATLLLLTVGLVGAGASLRSEHRSLGIYTLTALITLGLTAQSKTPKYGLPLLPMFLLIAAAGSGRILADGSTGMRRRRVAIGVAALFLITCASRSWRYFSRSVDEPARHAELLAGIDPEALVVADLTFVFDELGRRRLRGLWAYRVEAEARGERIDLRGLIDAARDDDVDHLVLDYYRGLPRRLAREWSGLEEPLHARVRRHDEGEVLILDLEARR